MEVYKYKTIKASLKIQNKIMKHWINKIKYF